MKMEGLVMIDINPFGVGKAIGNKVIKPVVNIIAGTFWGVVAPAPEDKCILHPPRGRFALTPETRIDLEDALRMGNKKEFMKRIKFWEKILKLDSVKVAYTITSCLEAMKWGSSDIIRSACLNLLGSSFFK